MIDPNILRYNPDWVAVQLARRKFVLDVHKLRTQEKLRKFLQKKIDNLRLQRKNQAKIIGIAKFNGEDTKSLQEKAYLLGKQLISINFENKILQKEIKKYAWSLPNIPDADIPNGFENKDNLEIMRWGKLKQYDFPLRDHVELGKLIEGLDFSNAVKLAGSRFVVMQGTVAYLYRALSQFMIDLHTKSHGYKEYYVPYLVNETALYGSGQLPKFYKDLFHMQSLCSDVNMYTLIPTAEVPLINLMSNVFVNEEKLPIKMMACTPCFRSEAGTYGRHSRGLIRMHQFDKVEMVQVVHPDKSAEALEEITSHAEKVLQLLKLPYRKVLLSAGNIGFTSRRTYDLEVWLPAQNTYCEISSCSNVGDFQSRRIKACFRNKNNKKLKFLHILNGSGVAIGRALVAVLENYQLEDGHIEIPKILIPYMNGLTYI